MSIGDSLLDYMSEEEILNNKRNYFKGKRKYYVVGIYNNLEVYQVVDVYLKTKDKKYSNIHAMQHLLNVLVIPL